jgi:hypothetical protein
VTPLRQGRRMKGWLHDAQPLFPRAHVDVPTIAPRVACFLEMPTRIGGRGRPIDCGGNDKPGEQMEQMNTRRNHGKERR